MAISPATQTFIFSVVDAQQEFVIKCFIFGFLIGLVWFLNNKYANNEPENIPQMFRNVLFKCCYYVTLTVVPFASILLLRDLSFFEFYLIILSFYSLIFTIVGLLLLVGVFDKLKEVLGMTKVTTFKDTNYRKGERL